MKSSTILVLGSLLSLAGCASEVDEPEAPPPPAPVVVEVESDHATPQMMSEKIRCNCAAGDLMCNMKCSAGGL